jgi:hypothetical protein
MKTQTAIWLGCFSALGLGCTKAASNGGPPGPGGSRQLEPGSPVALTLSPSREAERTEVNAALAGVTSLTAADFAAKYRVPFATGIGYDPTSAKGLELIQGSPLKLVDDELAALRARGFTISRRQQFPNFALGYRTIYMADLPVYVSADSILEAVHRSYDDLLKEIETTALAPDLHAMLEGMQRSLASTLDENGGEYDPTIADVHTQPTDEAGNPVGKVLHVGTGMPRLMVVSVDGRGGPQAYAGLVSSYFEQITGDFQRLDDPTWAATVQSMGPADVPWMKDLILP